MFNTSLSPYSFWDILWWIIALQRGSWWDGQIISLGHSKGLLGNNCLLFQNISQWFIFDSSNNVVLRCSELSQFGEELLVVKLDSKTCDICFHAQPTNRGSQHPQASQQKRSVAGEKKIFLQNNRARLPFFMHLSFTWHRWYWSTWTEQKVKPGMSGNVLFVSLMTKWSISHEWSCGRQWSQ